MKLTKIPRPYRWTIKRRLRVLAYVKEHSLKGASQHFALDRKTVRAWRDRYRAGGVLGLVPRYPAQRRSRLSTEVLGLIEQARRDLEYGASRTRIWLLRVHKLRLPVATIHRAFHRLGLQRLPRRRKRVPRPRQLRLFEKAHPGESIQVDVKVVKVNGQKFFQYTALDDCTRFRVLRLYRRQNQHASLDFLSELRRDLPFPMRQLQTDNGSEFPLAFMLTVEAAGIRHRYIRPRQPQQNGKVERSLRIDHEEFWSKQAFKTFTAAAVALRTWERIYNVERFSLALAGRTPAEKLAALLRTAKVA